MIVIAVDPGYEQSAVVVFDGTRVLEHRKEPNAAVLRALGMATAGTLVIEQIESFGMPVGREVFETVFWAGRFAQAFRGQFDRVPRRAVKLHLCASAKAKDANIRQALIDRFGPGKERAIGCKAAPGPLYGVVADQLAALAVAVTWWDQQLAAARRSA